MERLMVDYVRNRFKGGPCIKTLKKILYETYPVNKWGDKPDIRVLQLDHIIPYCISLDNSISNLQLLKPREHAEKSGRDKKIINEFKKLGWIEKLTNYSHQLNKSIPFLVKEFKIKLVELVGLDSKSHTALTCV